MSEKEWLVADRFSVADLNVSAVMLLLKRIDFSYSEPALHLLAQRPGRRNKRDGVYTFDRATPNAYSNSGTSALAMIRAARMGELE